MDNQTKTLLRTIELVHEASLDDKLWVQVMENLRQTFNGNKALLFSPMLALKDPYSIWASANISSDELGPYHDYFFDKDLWEIEGNKRGILTTGSVNLGHTIVDDNVFENSEWYNDYLKKIEIRHILSGIIDDGRQDVDLPKVFISIFRDQNSTSFDDRNGSILSLFVPHIQNSLMLRQKLVAISVYQRTIEGMLSSLLTPALLIDSRGVSIEVNEAAERLFIESRALKLIRGKLSAERVSDDNKLQKMIYQIINPIANLWSEGGSFGKLQIFENTSEYPLHLSFYRLPKNHRAFSKQPVAVIYIKTPNNPSLKSFIDVAPSFSLTNAEQAFCMELVKGASLKVAADTLKITHGTASQRLKTIFRKTDTNSQSSLMRLMLMYSIP